MDKMIRQDIVDELSHFCYICHKRFYLVCGEPQIKMGGCCSGAVWGKTKYIRPVYAHLPCFQAKEVKRKQTIYKLPVIKKIIGAYAKQELRDIKKGYSTATDPVFKGIFISEEKQFKAWLQELGR